MFAGICRMHRVQLRQVRGGWDLAAEDARIVCTELAGMNTAVVAEAQQRRCHPAANNGGMAAQAGW